MGMDIVIGARVPDDLWYRVKKHARENDTTTSYLIRKGLEMYLNGR